MKSSMVTHRVRKLPRLKWHKACDKLEYVCRRQTLQGITNHVWWKQDANTTYLGKLQMVVGRREPI